MSETPPPPEGWRYSDVAEPRLSLLAERHSIDGLINQLLSGATVNTVNPSELCNELEGKRLGASRVSLELEFISNASREAADYLMNGVSGLRATYASDHVVGSRVNSAVCQVIADAILDSRIKISRGTPNSVRETLRECVATTMSKLSAKV
jgi:hypothetical protein